MKSIWNKIALPGLAFMALCTTPFVLQGCDDDEETKWVDLRYRVEDAYTLPHHDDADTPENELAFTFQVKSTDPWEVFGEQPDAGWYTINPATGDDPTQTYDVTITCQPNESLDDRTDVIHVKSDYWTGKTFTLTQKGTAYMTNDYQPVEGLGLIPMDGSPVTFKLNTNQNWTAEAVSEGDWLHVENAAGDEGTQTLAAGPRSASGTGNGQVEGEDFELSIWADPNTGAMRYGTVVVYDRNGDVGMEITVTQDGVQLEPTQPENGVYWPVYGEAQDLTLHVVSNSRWTVSKENEVNDNWFEFEATEFDGTGDIVLHIQEHGESVATRTANLVLESVSEDPSIEPVTTTIQIRQASTDAARTTEYGGVTNNGGDVYLSAPTGGVAPGLYNFYVEPFSANLEFFFMWSGVETSNGEFCQFNYKIMNGSTQMTTTPWNNLFYSENSGRAVDTSMPHVIGIDYTTETTDAGTFLGVEFFLDGESHWGRTISDGRNEWRVTYDVVKDVACSLLLRTNGPVTFSRWTYTSAIDWGE